MTHEPDFNPQQTDEAAITRALEHFAPPQIPADFAARVVAALPQQAPRRVARPVGRTIALLAAALLTLALFALAPHTAPNFTNLAFDLELLLLAQLCGIAWLLSPRPGKW